jgi:hypothetical protein
VGIKSQIYEYDINGQRDENDPKYIATNQILIDQKANVWNLFESLKVENCSTSKQSGQDQVQK